MLILSGRDVGCENVSHDVTRRDGGEAAWVTRLQERKQVSGSLSGIEYQARLDRRHMAGPQVNPH